jgi:hypothetical protein
MSTHTVYVATLQRAAALLGSTLRLAAHLHVSHNQLRHWMRGEGAPSSDVFLRAVDIISTLTETREARSTSKGAVSHGSEAGPPA